MGNFFFRLLILSEITGNTFGSIVGCIRLVNEPLEKLSWTIENMSHKISVKLLVKYLCSFRMYG